MRHEYLAEGMFLVGQPYPTVRGWSPSIPQIFTIPYFSYTV